MSTDISLGEKAFAVTYDPELGWNLYIPHMEEEDSMDEVGAALIATFMRLQHEQDFFDQQTNWLLERVANENNE